MLLMLLKDLRVLRRTPVLLAVLVLYPLMIAALVGLVAGYASSKPRVAFVDEDGLPARLTLAGHTFDVQSTIDRVATEVRLVRLDADEARRELQNGKVIATVTVPPGFVARLQVMVESPTLELETSKGGLSDRVRQQVQALVFNLNRELQQAYIDANLRYVKLIREGGRGDFLGQHFDLLGLGGAERLLREQPPGPDRDRILQFVRTARLALNQTDDALRATAHPIELVEMPDRGRTAVLSAQVQGYALALTLAFLALVLAAGALAGERDENVLGRLARGLVSPGSLLAAKVALAAIVSAALGLAVAVAFGVIIEVGGVTGGEPWRRMPLLAPALLLVGAALGALGTLLGALSREARTASLVSLLVVLPIVFLGLVPREVFPVAGWVSDALPFSHGQRLFSAALYDLSPWASVARETGWLAGLTAAYAAAARLGMRRFLA